MVDSNLDDESFLWYPRQSTVSKSRELIWKEYIST
jgi:hypothetical protein